MILSKNPITELLNVFPLISVVYQSTAEQVGRSVCINLSCLLSHINVSYQATAASKQSKSRSYIVLCTVFFFSNKTKHTHKTNSHYKFKLNISIHMILSEAFNYLSPPQSIHGEKQLMIYKIGNAEYEHQKSIKYTKCEYHFC